MDTEPRKPGRLRRWLIRIEIVCFVTLAVLATLYGVGHLYLRWKYPYGWSHCCDKQLSLALYQYAEKHGGRFPAGEATPEASLSLLYRDGLIGTEVLRGKTVPEATVRDILERGDLLGPDTCGWHYVEGLNLKDDRRLALFWDKAGLDHNGGRLKGGGHTVWLVGCQDEHIPEAKWNDFLREQEALWAQRKNTKTTAAEARAEFGGQKVLVRLRKYDSEGRNYLEARVWHGEGPKARFSLHKRLAAGDRRTAEENGLPFIPENDLACAKVIVENEQQRIRFLLEDEEIIFKDDHFEVMPTGQKP